MTILHPQTALEAVTLRKETDNAVYLAGGTDDLRLGSAAEGKTLIDINGLVPNTISVKDGKVFIGAGCTLQDIVESDAVPAFIKEAAGFCTSYARRNSATIGGNLGLRRQDSYLAAALTAAEAVVLATTPHGEKEEPVGEYVQGDCRCLLEYIVVKKTAQGWVKRFGNTSASHATLIAAAGAVYALSVSGSDFTYGPSAELAKAITFCDDITGSAEYKKYLAETVFTLGR